MKLRLSPSLKIVIAVAAFLLPFSIACTIVFSGGFAFWYDPARDFLLASDNLKKITLIGPTSGIPGIFYGPYWIWSLSFGQIFSQDPRIVIFISITLPYFILLPYILWKYYKFFGFTTVIIMWLMFMLTAGVSYAVNPWNPHPAPLLFAVLIYALTTTDFHTKNKKAYWQTLLIGILSGLILNFHISFGLGVALGTMVFLLLHLGLAVLKKKLQKNMLILLIGCYLIGVTIMFLPFILFEFRHGFHQVQTALKVFSASGSVVSVTGISDIMIIQAFFGKLSDLLKMSLVATITLFILTVLYFAYMIRQKKIRLEAFDSKLLLFLGTTSCAILFLYLTSKNPVWSYHFIGVEVIFIFLIGFICSKNRMMRYFILGWLVIIIGMQLPGIITSVRSDPMKSSTFLTKKYIVEMIQEDANDSAYTVYAYSPSIYTYEYTYLFKWLTDKDVPYDPSNNQLNATLVYTISPSLNDKKVEDFVNYRTPNTLYKTIKTWHIPDGTIIMKRVKSENKN